MEYHLNKLIPILKDLWKNVIEPLVPVLGTVLVGAIGLVTDALNLALASRLQLLRPVAVQFAGITVGY